MRELWQKIQSSLQRVGDFQARLLLTFLYGLFAIPVGLFLRFNSDPLNLHKDQQRNHQGQTTHWQPRTTETTPNSISLQDAKRQG